MKLIINKDRSVIQIGTWGTVNENDYEILEFEFPAELDGYNKRIVYYLGDEKVWDAIVDNKAYITNAITTKGDVKAYVWCTKENTEREADTDFRTMLFDMHFYENENADGIVPTEEQVDGFNTMLTAMNAKIDEVDALETTIGAAEAERQEAEISREERTNEAIDNIVDMTEAYNQNAQEKTDAFNSNATQKTNDFNTHVTQKVNDFDTHAIEVTDNFDDNAAEKTEVIQDICDTARDFVSAVTFAKAELNPADGHLYFIGEESLGTMGFHINWGITDIFPDGHLIY